MQPFSEATQEAAGNLLDKADRALEAGDLERARHFARRAARLPFDRREEMHPAAWVAELDLYLLVTDALEDSEGDAWLGAAVEVMNAADDLGRRAVRDLLVVIDREYELGRGERATLRAAVAGIPAGPPLHEPALPEDELVTALLSLLPLPRAYLRALDA